MLTRLKLLRLQREMMETREKKMLKMREKKMMDVREKKFVDSREKKMNLMGGKTRKYNASKVKEKDATFKGRKARHQEGHFGKNYLILIELYQNDLQRESQHIKNSICQWKQHALS